MFTVITSNTLGVLVEQEVKVMGKMDDNAWNCTHLSTAQMLHWICAKISYLELTFYYQLKSSIQDYHAVHTAQFCTLYSIKWHP